ncbi:arylsulfatase B-like [Uloborus diversus]|uniref:arylsulfatase B-like n=1 Tax=Uloborus diversus TaxID=327109 RepID=UPI0024093B4A|nr:arylsulfatase B-like [Uloborus diversus]XP_054708783.1 arylsulfatase B-like [Uloborus diversus]
MGTFWKVLCLLTFISTATSKLPRKPHIVFMIVDDLGWSDVSFHGSKQIPTPNIDAIARDGIILNNYYVSPTCSPSRGSLMTGKYPLRLGFQHEVIIANTPWGLPLEEKILPQYMKSLKYTTRGIGKWHLGFFKEDYLPMKRGFDSFFGYWTGVEDYFTHFSNTRNATGLDLHDNFKNAWEYNGTYGTELFTAKAKEVIMEHNPAKPLFLYIGQQAPHSGNFDKPLQVPEKYVKPLVGIADEKRRTFAGMVSALDHSVGEIFDALEKSRMLENTIFVFTTDNGGAVEGTDGSYGSNWPLRGSKYNLWEGGVRGVSFMWSPFLRHRSRVYNELMHISDWLPTLLSAAGGAEIVKSLKGIDGVDQWPSLVHNAPSPRHEILHNIDPIDDVEGIRVHNFKLVKGSYYKGRFDGWYDKNGKPIKDVVPIESKVLLKLYKRNYKKYLKRSKAARILWRKYRKDPRLAYACLVPGCNELLQVKCGSLPPSVDTCKPEEGPCLFDVHNDPCEFYNIADQLPEVVAQLQTSMNKYKAIAKDPAGVPPDHAADPKLHGNAWMPWK